MSLTFNGEQVKKIIYNGNEAKKLMYNGVEAWTGVSPILNENSWETISEVARAGKGADYWNIGDCKEITLNGKVGNYLTLNNKKLFVFILDFNHEDNGIADNNIIFGGFKKNIDDTRGWALRTFRDGSSFKSYRDGGICSNMNHRCTLTGSGSAGLDNAGGWKGCDLRYDILGATSTPPLNYNTQKTSSNVGYDATASTLKSPKENTLLAALPSDLRNVIRLWDRWIDAVGNNSGSQANIQKTTDAITLLSEYEFFGRRQYANYYEQFYQNQMEYYVDTTHQIYNCSMVGQDVLAVCWLSSPDSNSHTQYCASETKDYPISKDATYEFAIAPAFKI